MGEAKNRGTAEERRQQRMTKMLDEAEVLIALNSDDKSISFQILPRDETPNQQSQAIIMASFIQHNFGNLMQTAMAAYLEHQAGGSDKPQMIKQQPQRSITTPEGGLAKQAPAIVGPDGRPIQ